MCGIAGAWLRSPDSTEALLARVRRMTEALWRRGPDAQGLWMDTPPGLGAIALGHRRLAVLDTSDAASQPMTDAAEQHALVFNGEIYNHRELRRELQAQGITVRSSGDTEVLLQCLIHWGVQRTLPRLRGMFALAWWDGPQGQLTLARDRLGKKPLYLHTSSAGVTFASQLSPLIMDAGLQAVVDMQALSNYLQLGYVGESSCMVRDIVKVQPGEWIEIEQARIVGRHSWWSLPECVAKAKEQPVLRMGEALELLRPVLNTAVRERMLSDVPLGLFLSGGIDSSLVATLMRQHNGSSALRSFAVGFDDSLHDESQAASRVAKHLGLEHRTFRVGERDAARLLPLLGEVLDEPMADASQIPTTLLALLARKEITVALTGDGGDEAFGGYERYRHMQGLLGLLHHAPRGLRLGMAGALSSIPSAMWGRAAALVPTSRRPTRLSEKAMKLAASLAAVDAASRTRAYISLWPQDIVRIEPVQAPDPARLSALSDVEQLLDEGERMQLWEMQHYLPGDLLTKMDRATMWASLEARSPLLDHRVIEVAWRLAPELKASKLASKRVLRALLAEFLPLELFERPKQGFSVPLQAWMRGALKPMVGELLESALARLSPVLDATQVRGAWQALQRGQAGRAEPLWAVVLLELWFQRWPVSLG